LRDNRCCRNEKENELGPFYAEPRAHYNENENENENELLVCS
jgi:hypothetical protein